MLVAALDYYGGRHRKFRAFVLSWGSVLSRLAGYIVERPLALRGAEVVIPVVIDPYSRGTYWVNGTMALCAGHRWGGGATTLRPIDVSHLHQLTKRVQLSTYGAALLPGPRLHYGVRRALRLQFLRRGGQVDSAEQYDWSERLPRAFD